MNVVKIEATTLPDAWYRTLFEMIENGRVFKIDQGSYAGQKRLEFDFVVISVKDPANKHHLYLPDAKRLLPQIPEQYGVPNPVEDEYIDNYLPYLMTDLVSEHESYTYGQRIKWNGLPANLAAIQLLKEYMAAEIGVEDGEMVCASKGLHIYDYAFDLAKCVRMKEEGFMFEGE